MIKTPNYLGLFVEYTLLERLHQNHKLFDFLVEKCIHSLQSLCTDYKVTYRSDKSFCMKIVQTFGWLIMWYVPQIPNRQGNCDLLQTYRHSNQGKNGF